jgi:hypothetical protein
VILPHVPTFIKPRVADLLESVLDGWVIPCTPGNCYKVAKELHRRSSGEFRFRRGFVVIESDGPVPQPHAWVSFRGLCDVDLYEELSCIENGFDKWQHLSFCSRCQGKPVVDGRRQCRRCLSHCRARRLKGFCLDCKTRMPRVGRSRCDACLSKDQIRTSRHRRDRRNTDFEPSTLLDEWIQEAVGR